MNIQDIDRLVARVINHLKEDTEHIRNAVLSGDMDYPSYRHETGILRGIEQSMAVLMEEAEKTIKSEIEDE